MHFKSKDICSPNVDFIGLRDRIYNYQLQKNLVYRRFVDGLFEKAPSEPPFLPVEAFRDARIYTEDDRPELEFRSSGTTTMVRSTHRVAYKANYEASIFAGLNAFYPIENMVVLGYTPGYSENPNSSLVWMINALIERDKSGLSRFLKIDEPISDSLLDRIASSEKQVLLFGAAFGLADLAEKHPTVLPDGSLIMETGGMKTYRKELSREALHTILADGFGVPFDQIHSEYGMTELMSQAYASGDMWFKTPPWMSVSIVDPFNPLRRLSVGEEGLIAIIDLANWASCPFLLTGDRGVLRADGAFQVLGRWSSYHLRGCNFLLENN